MHIGMATSAAVLCVLLTVLAGPLATTTTATAAADARSGTPGRVQVRPDAGADAEDGFTAPTSAIHHHDTTHFRLHWTSQTADAASIPYIKEAAGVLEEVWAAQIVDLGWPAPLADGGLGGNDLVDVYFVDLDAGVFGYAAADPEALCRGCDEAHGYLVLDNDYEGYPPDTAGALRATAAHEFSHLVQFGLAYHAEGWAYEATAVWLEQVSYPAADARTQYLQDFADAPELSLSAFDRGSGGFDRAYGAYVWNLWLANRHGPEIVRDAWQAAADHDVPVLKGYGLALADRGSLLEREFVAFTAATAGWDHGGFPGEPVDYPPIERQGVLERGSVTTVTVDHAAAHVVDVPAGREVTVTVRGPKFVAGGIGLVAVAGTEVLSVVDDTLFDGEASVTLVGANRASRVTLVIVNADPALAVPTPQGSDRPRYLFEAVEYLVGVDVDPGPLMKR